MRFPFVKRKDYEEVVDKLEWLLCEASGGKLSKHIYPLETMYDAMCAYTQFCCDGAVEEKTRELKAEIERLRGEVKEKTETVGFLKKESADLFNMFCEAKKEVEKLHPYKLHYGNLRMEIAREFADRLKNKINITTTLSKEQDKNIIRYIDNILEEMENECELH